MLREQILSMVRDYCAEHLTRKTFDRNTDQVNYAGRIFDAEEVVNLVDSALDFWLTEGRYAQEFRRKMGQFIGVKNVMLTNSGSSANLLALAALTSKKLKDRRLVPGDEVVTVAAGFPTTVTPIIQNRLIPVFVDISLPTYNIDVDGLARAISPKTKAVILAHTLGNPFDIAAVKEVCRQHKLWLIEDNADALGSTYDGKVTGSFGDLATLSFYPAHHITTGEGGAVVTEDDSLARIVTSFRDWGRDCYCETGKNNRCHRRFEQKFGSLPLGYDHKYVYSELGYNLKMTDMQAAIGVAQMDKLLQFCTMRRQNFLAYHQIFEPLKEWLILPEATERADPSWFGYTVSVKSDAPFTKQDLVLHLDNHRIDTRGVFGGNILRQPAFANIPHRKAGDLVQTDFVVTSTFFLGVYPGVTAGVLDYIKAVIADFAGDSMKIKRSA